MDQAEKLRHLVENNRHREKIFSFKSFFFCSLNGGTGCSTIALNTADLLSKEFKVILVEYNF